MKRFFIRCCTITVALVFVGLAASCRKQDIVYGDVWTVRNSETTIEFQTTRRCASSLFGPIPQTMLDDCFRNGPSSHDIDKESSQMDAVVLYSPDRSTTNFWYFSCLPSFAPVRIRLFKNNSMGGTNHFMGASRFGVVFVNSSTNTIVNNGESVLINGAQFIIREVPCSSTGNANTIDIRLFNDISNAPSVTDSNL